MNITKIAEKYGLNRNTLAAWRDGKIPKRRKIYEAIKEKEERIEVESARKGA